MSSTLSGPMLTRIAIGLVALVLVALGIMNAANKAGMLGAKQPPTSVVGTGFALKLPAIWHTDTGDLAELRDGVCKLVAPANSCAAYFVKGLGSPKALAVIAVGPAPAGGEAGLKAAMAADGAEVAGPRALERPLGGQRYRTSFKKRGRHASLAVTDTIPTRNGLLLLQVVAEEPEGRYQEALLAEIEKTLEVSK